MLEGKPDGFDTDMSKPQLPGSSNKLLLRAGIASEPSLEP
jgi:hypothetical protein